MNDSRDFLLIEAVVKLSAINKLLVSKGILTDQEVDEEMQEISKQLANQMKDLAPELFSQIN